MPLRTCYPVRWHRSSVYSPVPLLYSPIPALGLALDLEPPLTTIHSPSPSPTRRSGLTPLLSTQLSLSSTPLTLPPVLPPPPTPVLPPLPVFRPLDLELAHRPYSLAPPLVPTRENTPSDLESNLDWVYSPSPAHQGLVLDLELLVQEIKNMAQHSGFRPSSPELGEVPAQSVAAPHRTLTTPRRPSALATSTPAQPRTTVGPPRTPVFPDPNSEFARQFNSSSVPRRGVLAQPMTPATGAVPAAMASGKPLKSISAFTASLAKTSAAAPTLYGTNSPAAVAKYGAKEKGTKVIETKSGASLDEMMLFDWSRLHDVNKQGSGPWKYPDYPELTNGAPATDWKSARQRIAQDPRPIEDCAHDGLDFWRWTVHPWATTLGPAAKKSEYFYNYLPKLENVMTWNDRHQGGAVTLHIEARCDGGKSDLEPDVWFWVSRSVRKSPPYMDVIEHMVSVFKNVIVNGKVREFNYYSDYSKDIVANLPTVKWEQLGADLGVDIDQAILAAQQESAEEVMELTQEEWARAAAAGSSSRARARRPVEPDVIIKQEEEEEEMVDPEPQSKNKMRAKSPADILMEGEGQDEVLSTRSDPAMLARELAKNFKPAPRVYTRPAEGSEVTDLPQVMRLYMGEYERVVPADGFHAAYYEIALIWACDHPAEWEEKVRVALGSERWSEGLLKLMFKHRCIADASRPDF
ncbi:hypothetical protein CALVIDRAFT_561316 [Calocera viscosa TUFC12733]|uniref:Uncharacterized protein n=1 Tax=Calocera viscosa (strain TUFC12733) TaxID=1330018 RepID=A0A167Q6C5_CALVF|nr:hypothetical protein CALVIDRAFT_561316 [Calocera viscosa TUFC12733]